MINQSASLQRWWDMPAAVLVTASLMVFGTRFVATGWTDHLSIAQTVVFFGCISGLALGYSRFEPRYVRIYAFVYGSFLIAWQLWMTLPVEISWLQKKDILIERIGAILLQLAQNEPVNDPLLFLIAMFSLFWAISVHAGYAITRTADAWLAILPGFLGLFLIHSLDSTDPKKAAYLGAYLFLAIILVGRMRYIQNSRRWQESRTAVPPHLSFDLIRFTIGATFLIVMGAWTIPALAKTIPEASRLWRPVRRAWTERTSDFQNAFASLRPTMIDSTSGYGTSASLGLTTVQDRSRIFMVKAPLDLPAGIRLYWKARGYDQYQDGEWQSSPLSSQEFNPETDDRFDLPESGHWAGKFTFISMANFATIFTPGKPYWISKKANLEYGENTEGTFDLSAIVAEPLIRNGERYQVEAEIRNPSTTQLNMAGSDYPDWVREKYLQLPGSITERTKQLATEITLNQVTPYQKAAAITTYLRSRIQYVDAIEQPAPAGQDLVDWFLFDQQKGFCTYYATAEVILLRSLGIPARMAMGYAQGELLDDTQTDFVPTEYTYVVRQRDAHAWPEVYFPGIGWVEFEPTTSQADIQRLASNGEEGASLNEDGTPVESGSREQANDPNRAEPGQNDSPNPDGQNSLQVIFYILLALVVSAAGLFWAFPQLGVETGTRILRSALAHLGMSLPAWLEKESQRPESQAEKKVILLPVLIEKIFLSSGHKPPVFIQRWARHSEMPLAARYYQEINRALIFCGYPPAATDTPAERAFRLGQLLPAARLPAEMLVRQYQRSIYSQVQGDLQASRLAAGSIRGAAWSGMFHRMFKHFRKPAHSQLG